MGKDPLRRTSSVSGISGLRCSNSLDNVSDLDSGKQTVSGPPELRLRSCFFLRAAAEAEPPETETKHHLILPTTLSSLLILIKSL